jgi:hypothetical protein
MVNLTFIEHASFVCYNRNFRWKSKKSVTVLYNLKYLELTFMKPNEEYQLRTTGWTDSRAIICSEVEHPSLIQCTLSLFAVMFLLSQSLYAQNNSSDEQIMSIVRDDPRVKDILNDFPEVRLEPEYSSNHDIWIVNFIHEDKGEVGLMTIEPESYRILEFNFNIEKVPLEEREVWLDESDDDRMEEGLYEFLRSFLPRFNGMSLAWLSFILVVIVFGSFSRLLSLQNFDILLIYSLAPFLHVRWANNKVSYTGIFIVTIILFARCIWEARRKKERLLKLNIGNPRIVWTLIGSAFILHILIIYERHIGDVGLWSAIGGEYLLRTGRLPYGTEFGPNCVYGPLMYVLFVPAGFFASFIEVIPNQGFIILADFNNWHAMRGVQTTELVLDLLTLSGLYLLARKKSCHVTGLAVVFIYAISPYIVGMVSELGLERASHIAGMPFILFALLLLHRPAIAGLLLGIATGMLYYPMFLVPLWFGYLWRRNGIRNGVVFLGTYAAVGIICIIMLISMVQPIDESESPLGAFIDDTISQQQFKAGYGNSPLSFWGQYPEFAVWGKPTAGVLYCIFCLLLAFYPYGVRFEQMIAMTAAVLVGTQLVLSFGGGTYIGFYLATVMLVLFGFNNTCARQGENESL